MASITWAISGGRVVEVVDGQTRVTDISVDDYNAGRLPYGQVVGDPYTVVPHQDSPTNFDQSTFVAPWLEDVYRGNPLPGISPKDSISQENNTIDMGIGTAPGVYLLKDLGKVLAGPATTATGSGLDTGTGAPKPLAVVGPRDEFIGGSLGAIRMVGPGPLVGEMSGIRLGTLPRIVLGDQLGE